MTDIDYAARVARGIALMDQAWPEWATEIDLERLDIESGDSCMTAQYAQTRDEDNIWYDGKVLLGLDIDSYVDHGFMADRDPDYPTLTALWRAEIERRRAQGQDAPAEPEAGA